MAFEVTARRSGRRWHRLCASRLLTHTLCRHAAPMSLSAGWSRLSYCGANRIYDPTLCTNAARRAYLPATVG